MFNGEIFTVGDHITIKLYPDEAEFSGFLNSINFDGGYITLAFGNGHEYAFVMADVLECERA